VTKVRRNAALALAALAGAAVGAVLTRARAAPPRAPAEPQRGDPRADELRRKLAEARTASAEEDDFEAAGMGAETIVDDTPRQPVPPGPPPPLPPPRPSPSERPVGDEFEAMRRRIHEEGRTAAEEMRRAGEPPTAD
jgi:hypothetical protein